MKTTKTNEAISHQPSAKHTPGPWETGAMMTRVEVLPQGWRMPMLIADCHGKHSPESEAERVANARLIAAAPELLAVAQAFARLCDSYGALLRPTMAEIEAARDAIAKATGK